MSSLRTGVQIALREKLKQKLGEAMTALFTGGRRVSASLSASHLGRPAGFTGTLGAFLFRAPRVILENKNALEGQGSINIRSD